MQTNTRIAQLATWTALWVISQAIAAFGPIFLWGEQTSLTLLAIIGTIVFGLGMIRANIIHLRSLDELQQKIHLEAMGLTLGLVLVFGLSYSLLDTTNLIPFDAEISVVVIFMGLTYLAAVMVNNWRYL
ncbi:MAG: hypothetical protein P8O79_11515 [Halieaceae bacterium]|nr:hypothetical protein [Halieaceae bacterium]